MNEADRKIPLVALIGIPNSGKSTLLNKICGEKKAITAMEEHTTRDLNYGEDFWEGHFIRFVDTGGLVPDPKDVIQKEVQVKSWMAIANSDLLIWVVDRRQDPETISQEMLSRLWQAGKPFIVAINKVDDPNLDKEISEYAKLGGVNFVNVSAANGYGVNELMDQVVEQLEKAGFEPRVDNFEEVEEEVKEKKGRKMKKVRTKRDGSIEIYRENSSDGPGLYHSFESEDLRVNQIENIVFDFFGVIFETNGRKVLEELVNKYEVKGDNLKKLEKLLVRIPGKKRLYDVTFDTPEFWSVLYELLGQDESFKDEFLNILIKYNYVTKDAEKFINRQKEEGKKLYFISNILEISFENCLKTPVMQQFDGGVASYKVGMEKPNPGIYRVLLEKYNLDPEKTVFIDDKMENVQGARNVGMWSFWYSASQKGDLDKELEKIERGFVERVEKTPKVLLLGKPNVGKSSLFNALCQEEIQIVTEIAGTTLSVNDYLIEQPNRGKKYLLMDTVGIRKPGKRTFGVESFATYRTVQAAHEADVLCLILDGSQPVSHQDQLVAGICKEAKKGLVVIANKNDLVDDEQRAKFIKDFRNKFKFLKVDRFLWISAKDWQESFHKKENPGEVLDIWEAIDDAIVERKKYISREEIRKLFNYLMKKKPPNKLSTKKRPVIYDLLYVRAEPPTFHLLVKDRTTVHWSYVRFLENTLRKQFNLYNTGLVLKLVEVDRKKVYG